ncbi:hypothetical protein HO173_003182 [Letharia columbiana]|uniref:Uncharacterized protein n=1 Tax=Letharia columbiana TaxID=112416 RepID=A0A8H6L7S5_9LECA|nr:uncharacterized protein HO173_003182 [Letharia columbiana]KAF6238676.1 hypothetical protein HO173_003182 [Letharia columbiana]
MENTAEKPSGNKATIVKNTAQLSKIPRQIITQQASSASHLVIHSVSHSASHSV